MAVKLSWSGAIHYKTGGKFEWPNEDGVYVIAKETDSKLKARYVGQGNIRDRMKTHESDDEPNTCLKKVMSNRDDVKVYYAKVTNDADRDNAEYTIFYYYGGTEKLCNEIAPQGKLLYDLDFPFTKIEVNY